MPSSSLSPATSPATTARRREQPEGLVTKTKTKTTKTPTSATVVKKKNNTNKTTKKKNTTAAEEDDDVDVVEAAVPGTSHSPSSPLKEAKKSIEPAITAPPAPYSAITTTTISTPAIPAKTPKTTTLTITTTSSTTAVTNTTATSLNAAYDAFAPSEMIAAATAKRLAARRSKSGTASPSSPDSNTEEDPTSIHQFQQAELEAIAFLDKLAQAEASEPKRRKPEVNFSSGPLVVVDISEEVRQRVEADIPAFLQQVQSITERIAGLRSKVKEIAEKVSSKEIETSKGVSLLELKVHSLLSYLTHVCMCILLKLNGAPLENHSAVDGLVELRVVIEKIKPLEQKLKYQIDKLVRQATQASRGEGKSATTKKVSDDPDSTDVLQFRPNPTKLVGATEGEDGDIALTGKGAGDDLGGDGVYRPPRIAPMPYDEEGGPKRRRGELSERARERAARSSIVRDLADTYGSRPEEQSASGTGYGRSERLRGRDGKEVDLEAIERAEEDHFTRFSMTKERNKMEKRMRRRLGDAGMREEIEGLESHFEGLHAIDRAVREEEEDRFGAIALGKRNRQGGGGSSKRLKGGAEELLASAAAKLSREIDPFGEQLETLKRTKVRESDSVGVKSKKVKRIKLYTGKKGR
ncbi:hypothetical protein DFJ73DRAFT_863277 [Zopfochytrium polystomum]|nr:hypothetical protein DFJ73DRAFT_863277 [Zopfochytrium polystomum]